MYAYRLNTIHPAALTPMTVNSHGELYHRRMNDLCTLAPRLGWMGDMGQRYVMHLPYPSKLMFAVAFSAARRGEFYVGSPVELPYLNDLIDYDTRTDSDEQGRAERAVREVAGETFAKPYVRRLNLADWRVSGSGNKTTRILGVPVVVTARTNHITNNTEYVGCIIGVNNRKLFTPVQRTDVDAMRYLTEHFDDMVTRWNTSTKGDNGDDDDDEAATIILRRP